ncbi:hypothetical protein MPER_11635 [Moniliophthora perniciosa FA553]|nr:hypothetical protein MPER_11635 [Moniliophthora perniciosa FA553]
MVSLSASRGADLMVHAREEPTSARAISEELIEEMYNFGRQPEYFDIKPFAPQSHKEHSKKWGGPKFRRLLHFVYTISFVCLLHIDEALKIRMKHIQIINGTTLKLTLPFRKTNQFGDIKPFYIKMFPEEYEYLCPVCALMEWLRVSRINSGYICRKISKLDEVHDNRHEPMVFGKTFLTFMLTPRPTVAILSDAEVASGSQSTAGGR